jgi:hypothetical protein
MNRAESDTQAPPVNEVSRAKWAGQIIGGFLLGLALLPAALELLSLVGNISPFRYQGF